MGRSHRTRLPFRTTTTPQLEPEEHGANSGDCSRTRDVPLTAKRALVEITSKLLKFAYGAVRRWKREGIGQEIERELRAQSQVPISRMSSLFLVLLRSALPRLDGKRASKMALALACADDQAVTAKRLAGFLWHNGGIEGAARKRASAVRRASSVSG